MFAVMVMTTCRCCRYYSEMYISTTSIFHLFPQTACGSTELLGDLINLKAVVVIFQLGT